MLTARLRALLLLVLVALLWLWTVGVAWADLIVANGISWAQ